MPRTLLDRRPPARWRQHFAGRSAIVTGGASGIGAALATELAACGAHVVVADVDGAAAQAAARETAVHVRSGGSVHAAPLDVTDRAAFSELVGGVVDERDGLDLLFNNAGIAFGGPTEEQPPEWWDRAIAVNLGGVVNGVNAALPSMIARRRGQIVNTASAAGLVPAVFAAAYCATKHGVVGLSGALRPELAEHGIGVTVLCPGMVETPILDKPPPADLPQPERIALSGREYLTSMGMRPIGAARFARTALRAVARDRAVVVTPANPRMGWWLQRASPRVIEAVNRRAAVRVREAMAVGDR